MRYFKREENSVLLDYLYISRTPHILSKINIVINSKKGLQHLLFEVNDAYSDIHIVFWYL
jgi:hypothetical protein